MPYMVKVAVTHGGLLHDVGTPVTDELGSAIGAEHPGALVRVPHDDDLCPASCAHESHVRAPQIATAASKLALTTEG